MARKKRRRKSKTKKHHGTKATKPAVTRESPSASTEPSQGVGDASDSKIPDEPRGMVAGEEVTITSGEIVLAPEKGLDVSFGESSGIIVDEGAGEILAESRNEHKVVGEIVLNKASGSASESSHHGVISGSIEISGDGVVVEEEPSAASSDVGASQKGAPESDAEDVPTQPIGDEPQAGGSSEEQKPVSDDGQEQGQPEQSDVSGLPEPPPPPPPPPPPEDGTASEGTPSGELPPPPPPPPPEDTEDGTGQASSVRKNPYVLTEEEHEALLRKREEQQKMSARLRHAFPSPFEMSQDLKEVMDRKADPSKFESGGDDAPARELKLESLRDLVPIKNRPAAEGDASAPEPKARPGRKRKSSGSIPVDRAFTEAEKAFFEEDLEEDDDTGAIEEIFDQMDAKARAQRGWLDSLKELIAPGKESPKSRSRKSRRKRSKPNSGNSNRK